MRGAEVATRASVIADAWSSTSTDSRHASRTSCDGVADEAVLAAVLLARQQFVAELVVGRVGSPRGRVPATASVGARRPPDDASAARASPVRQTPAQSLGATTRRGKQRGVAASKRAASVPGRGRPRSRNARATRQDHLVERAGVEGASASRIIRPHSARSGSSRRMYGSGRLRRRVSVGVSASRSDGAASGRRATRRARGGRPERRRATVGAELDAGQHQPRAVRTAAHSEPARRRRRTARSRSAAPGRQQRERVLEVGSSSDVGLEDEAAPMPHGRHRRRGRASTSPAPRWAASHASGSTGSAIGTSTRKHAADGRSQRTAALELAPARDGRRR